MSMAPDSAALTPSVMCLPGLSGTACPSTREWVAEPGVWLGSGDSCSVSACADAAAECFGSAGACPDEVVLPQGASRWKWSSPGDGARVPAIRGMTSGPVVVACTGRSNPGRADSSASSAMCAVAAGKSGQSA